MNIRWVGHGANGELGVTLQLVYGLLDGLGQQPQSVGIVGGAVERFRFAGALWPMKKMSRS